MGLSINICICIATPVDFIQPHRYVPEVPDLRICGTVLTVTRNRAPYPPLSVLVIEWVDGA